MIYDYYDPLKFNELYGGFFKDVDRVLQESKTCLKYDDHIYSYLEIYKDNPSLFSKKYNIDKNGYLFWFATKYTINSADKKKINEFLSHPYIRHYKLNRGLKYISTIFGTLEFSLAVSGKKDAMRQANNKEQEKVLYDIYLGKMNHNCHNISLKLGKNSNIITAFMPTQLENLRYLHTYLEHHDSIFDYSNNLMMLKEDYDVLFKPEIVTKINGEECAEVLNYVKNDSYLKEISLKQFLVEYYEIKNSPGNVKIKNLNKNIDK